MAVQGIGKLAGGYAAERLGPEPVVALSGIAGLTAAAALALIWTESRGDTRSRMRPRAAA